METNDKVAVEMTADELRELQELRAAKARQAEEERRKEELGKYQQLVDAEVTRASRVLRSTSDVLSEAKREVFDNFRAILDLKCDLLRVRDGQRSHTFTTSDDALRLTLGYRCVDGFGDRADDGVAMVKEALADLATDDNARALVNMVLSLLAKDASGNLNAQRVLQLQKVATDSGNERIIEGARMIQEAYKPRLTKQFITLEMKNSDNQWVKVPLSMTDVTYKSDL